MSGIRLWNGDIGDLEVDAIVVPATPTLWMTAGAAAAVKQRGGHGIEFEAVSLGPQHPGGAVATGAGTLPCRYVIHAVSLVVDRRTSAEAIDAATRSAMRLADGMGLREVAFPAMGSPVGDVTLEACAAVMLRAIRETLPGCTSVQDVVLALRGARTYEVFQAELERQREPDAVPVVPGAYAGLVGVMDPGAVRQGGAEPDAAAPEPARRDPWSPAPAPGAHRPEHRP